MGKRIIISNLKGGVGKTMSAFQLAGFLSGRGYKTLCIDCDPQGNLTRAFLPKRIVPGVFEWFDGKASFQQIVKQPFSEDEVLKNIYLLPNTYDLFLIKEGGKYDTQMLKSLMKPFDHLFDFILVDTGPNLSLVNINTFVYGDYILPVFDTTIDSIEGFQYLYQTAIEPIKNSGVNPKLAILGILLNHTDRRTKISREFTSTLNKIYGKLLFKTNIPMVVKNQESRLNRIPIVRYFARSFLCVQYEQLLQEIEFRIKENER